MFREATVDDLTALLDLERAANLAGLGHVFPPERYPFPDDDVLARWALVLDEPGVDVLVRDAPDGGIDLFAAYDDRSLRHLAVHPGQWGSGLATTAIETVLRSMDERGTTIAELWCLEENTRARRLYEYLGWRRGAGPPARALAAAPDGDALHPADPAVGPLMPEALVARGTPQGRWVLTAAVLGSGMAMLDGTVVNIALRSIGNDLGRVDRPAPVGGQRLPARARVADPGRRLARATTWAAGGCSWSG